MATIKTVADKRVVAEQGVILNQYVGPLNWEHYKIPASGISNSQLTFANLVTLGTNRLYDSSFQIEYTIEVDLTATQQGNSEANLKRLLAMHPFPLHWVTDQLRTNINGAACMVRPQESLPQRMMYWRQDVINKTCNFCPHTKAPSVIDAPIVVYPGVTPYREYENFNERYGKYNSKDLGMPLECINFSLNNNIATITIREPVLCPPFNQRLDEVYQSPLFNITSIDIVYQLNDLRRMFTACETNRLEIGGDDKLYTKNAIVSNLEPVLFGVNIKDAALCFNVASMPSGMTVPPILQLPYYDNVCYVTSSGITDTTAAGLTTVEMTSGVYTLAQVPTAIYIFVSENQLFRSSITSKSDGSCYYDSSYSPIKDINITLGNNTQLLTTTSELDRYQMAIANGLENVTYEEFTSPILKPYKAAYGEGGTYANMLYNDGSKGGRCILRLIPGIDLLIPDKRLVGGSDAEQMVFQVKVSADISGVPVAQRKYLSLWIMFEYVGTLTIEPVHASIDMLPIKSLPPIGSIDAVADTSVGAATGGGEGTNPTGAGIFDIIGMIRKGYNAVKKIWNNPTVKRVRGVADDILSYDEPATKGGRIIGGTIVGDNVLGKYIQ